MSDSFVAIVVSVPEEYFPDGDDICLTAGKYVSDLLESHLIQHEHTIANWVRGGCEEDWGVYFESQRNQEVFDYAICFFAAPKGEVQCQMVVQYHMKIPLLKRLFKKSSQLSADHHLHKTMQEFGKIFSKSRMLTQSQFEAEY